MMYSWTQNFSVKPFLNRLLTTFRANYSPSPKMLRISKNSTLDTCAIQSSDNSKKYKKTLPTITLKSVNNLKLSELNWPLQMALCKNSKMCFTTSRAIWKLLNTKWPPSNKNQTKWTLHLAIKRKSNPCWTVSLIRQCLIRN